MSTPWHRRHHVNFYFPHSWLCQSTSWWLIRALQNKWLWYLSIRLKEYRVVLRSRVVEFPVMYNLADVSLSSSRIFTVPDYLSIDWTYFGISWREYCSRSERPRWPPSNWALPSNFLTHRGQESSPKQFCVQWSPTVEVSGVPHIGERGTDVWMLLFPKQSLFVVTSNRFMNFHKLMRP